MADIPDNKKKHRVFFRLDELTWQSLQSEAGAKNLTLSDIIRDRLRSNSTLQRIEAKLDRLLKGPLNNGRN